MFDIQTLQTNSENPTFIAILISVVMTIVLSALIVITYDLTTRSLDRNHHFLQSMAMISIMATMVMQAVGDSLARGLGMLGALAIIRFRTTLKDPRNMTFMFASLAIGISCGAFGYTIATVGTFAFCMMAFILRFSPFGKQETLTGDLRIVAFARPGLTLEIEKILKEFASSFSMKEYRTRDKKVALETEYQYGKKIVTESEQQRLKEIFYDIKIRKDKDDVSLMNRLSEEEYVKQVKLKFTRLETDL